MRTYHPFLVGLGVIVAFSSVLFLLPANDLSGVASHPLYPAFAEPVSASIVDGRLRVVDTLVYGGGWYSVGGGPWQRFSLSGTSFGDSWLSGAGSYSLPSALDGVGEHYVIVYSCSSFDGLWDCHGGKWQLFTIGVEGFIDAGVDDDLVGDDLDESLDDIDLDDW